MSTVGADNLARIRSLAWKQDPGATFVVLLGVVQPDHEISIEPVRSSDDADTRAREYGGRCCIVELASGHWSSRWHDR